MPVRDWHISEPELTIETGLYTLVVTPQPETWRIQISDPENAISIDLDSTQAGILADFLTEDE